MRVLICGNPRSGNTLMKYLCAVGFADSEIGVKEVDPRWTDEQPATNMFYKVPHLAPEIPEMLERGYGIIFMARHPRGNWTSQLVKRKGQPIPHERAMRWGQYGRIYLRHKSEIILVRYEDLVLDPNKEQKRIAEWFDLEITVPFDECYKHGARYGGGARELKRKIDPAKSRVMPVLNKTQQEYFKFVVGNWPEVLEMMPEFGYGIDTF